MIILYDDENINIKFNTQKLLRIYSFVKGFLKQELDYYSINNFINSNQNEFISKSCLIISKNIIGYGGNQKATSN